MMAKQETVTITMTKKQYEALQYVLDWMFDENGTYDFDMGFLSQAKVKRALSKNGKLIRQAIPAAREE